MVLFYVGGKFAKMRGNGVSLEALVNAGCAKKERKKGGRALALRRSDGDTSGVRGKIMATAGTAHSAP